VTAEEFIAAITQHIPEKSFQMVRYYGWYSNRAGGDRKKKCLQRPGDKLTPRPTESIEVLDISQPAAATRKNIPCEPFDDGWLGYEGPFITVQ
jgi:hypothetical protein